MPSILRTALSSDKAAGRVSYKKEGFIRLEADVHVVFLCNTVCIVCGINFYFG